MMLRVMAGALKTSSNLSLKPVTWFGIRNNFAASSIFIKARALSYSYMPISKTPTTLSRFSLGMTPAGVGLTCGVIKVILSPTLTPMARARSYPRITPKLPGCRLSKRPFIIFSPMVETLDSSVGFTPRTKVPRTRLPWLSMAWPSTKGADSSTWGWFCIWFCNVGQSDKAPDRSVINACEVIPKMRSRNSFSNPFITDKTVIKAATPNPTPSMEVSEIKEMKWFRRFARV